MGIAPSSARVALVLGAGGVVGFSYLAGALAALEEVVDVDLCDMDLIVGTSAGAVAGALLSSGLRASSLYRYELADRAAGGTAGGTRLEGNVHEHVFAPAFHDPLGLLRRGVGSAVVLARSFSYAARHVPVVELWRRAFPSGLFTLQPLVETLLPLLPATWPRRKLFLCACDLAARRRAVFGTPAAPPTSVATAMKASCAIPGFYESVQIAGREYVDGGILSTTHLDLAAGHDLVIGIAPMAYDRRSGGLSLHPARFATEIYRRYPTKSLQTEISAVRDSGGEVLLIQPSRNEASRHGFSLMWHHDFEGIARRAYRAVVEQLASDPARSTLRRFGLGRVRSRSRPHGATGGAIPAATAAT
jgi:NTE family protein